MNILLLFGINKNSKLITYVWKCCSIRLSFVCGNIETIKCITKFFSSHHTIEESKNHE
jgi:hypothetical protein